jgi:hypothetical protein
VHPRSRIRCAAALVATALTVATGLVLTSAPAQAAAITVSADYTATAGTLDKNQLLNASQGGYLTMRDLHWLPEQAPELARLGLREVRIDHVFDDAFYGVVTAPGTYNFSKLDAQLLPLARAGIRPFISLSYMPAALGPSLFGPPTDNTAWGNAVRALVAHYVGLGYTGWKWEMWNEPDGSFWSGTQAQFDAMYAASATAVRAADPTAQIGGPATTSPTAGFLGSFLDYLAANPSVACDFISWHSYGPNDFTGAATVRSAISSRGLPAKKLYVTEWNQNWVMNSGPGALSDTNADASYAARRLYTAIAEPGLTGVYFFSPVEGLTPTADFNGDLGLITVDGHRKAVGNVFDAVNRMGGTRLTTTVGGAADTSTYGLVTADTASRKVSVLLWNDASAASTVSLSLSNLPYAAAGSNISVSQSPIDATHGNYWADYAAGITNQRPAPNEDLRPASRSVVAPAASFSQSISLGAHAVTLVELTPTTESTGAKTVHAEPAVTDLARGRTVTAGSTYTNTAVGWSPAAATDGRRHSFAGADSGNPAMGWTSADHTSATATEWVQTDLGSSKSLDTVTLWPRDDQAGDGRNFPADFSIAGSTDGSTWTTLTTKTGYGAGAAVSGPQTFPVTAGSYRYVRVTATKLGLPVTEGGVATYRFQLAELEVSRIGVTNPGFESGSLGGWTNTGGASVTASGVRSGGYAATFTGAGKGVNVTVTGLSPNTTYTFGGYLRSGASGDLIYLGAKSYGGAETSVPVGTTWYSPAWVTFTTGATNTSANLYAFKNGGTAQAWFDDFVLVAG